jgi:L-asparaginase II
MLARARTVGWPEYGYEREEHPVQRSATDTVAEWTGMPAPRLIKAVDGCGVVVYSLPLEHMARSYARLAAAYRRGEEVPRRIVEAMRSRPFLVGGTERFDSVVIEETAGTIIAKVGAEGVHSVAVLEAGIGFALKVEDGATRAQYPAVLRLLQLIGALPQRLPPRLEELQRRPVRNTRNEVVGEVRPVA